MNCEFIVVPFGTGRNRIHDCPGAGGPRNVMQTFGKV